ncbi:NADP-dependent oxidoreductase [Umezawaea beigongshangensis]|uniref:NADP-dependent oxidoreductase n=1 Tax=Umezawaea beigongshangensis TaxID=2780383 RepID=UPI0018F15388|nr:NADP-dependent oxidoreductase [Umezawaea beigongshangensis]
MKAVRYHRHGDVDVLQHEDVERPVPGAGQVLVRVAATSFNPVDAGIRAGHLQQVFPLHFPHVPGIDVAGTVAELGDGATGWAVGDTVVGFLPMNEDGAAAEFVLAPADVLAAAPSTVPLADAAALPAVGLTAWQALFEHADLREGQRVLVNGAGGAVGGYAVQLAKRAGAFVVATAAPRSADRVRSAGADEVVDRTTTAVTDAVTEPVDVVLNLAPVTGEEVAALVGLVRPGGVLVSTTAPAPADTERGVRTSSVFVRGDAAQLAGLVALVDAGELRVHVGARRPLADLAAVHEQSVTGGLDGKVVLIPG